MHNGYKIEKKKFNIKNNVFIFIYMMTMKQMKVN